MYMTIRNRDKYDPWEGPRFRIEETDDMNLKLLQRYARKTPGLNVKRSHNIVLITMNKNIHNREEISLESHLTLILHDQEHSIAFEKNYLVLKIDLMEGDGFPAVSENIISRIMAGDQGPL